MSMRDNHEWKQTPYFKEFKEKQIKFQQAFNHIPWGSIVGALPSPAKEMLEKSLDSIGKLAEHVAPRNLWQNTAFAITSIPQDFHWYDARLGLSTLQHFEQRFVEAMYASISRTFKPSDEMYADAIGGTLFSGELPWIGKLNGIKLATSNRGKKPAFGYDVIRYFFAAVLSHAFTSGILPNYIAAYNECVEKYNKWSTEQEELRKNGFAYKLTEFYKNSQPIFDAAIESLKSRSNHEERILSEAAATFLYSQYHALLSTHQSLSGIGRPDPAIKQLLQKLTDALYEHPQTYREFMRQASEEHDALLHEEMEPNYKGYRDFGFPMMMPPSMMEMFMSPGLRRKF